MLYKFFIAQWENEIKNDWTKTVRKDLVDLNLKVDLQYIQSLSQWSFKNLIKIRMKEYVQDKLNEEKFRHSKMDNIVHTELKSADYLLSEDISVEKKRTIFLFRTHMTQFSENAHGFPSSLHRMC